MNTEPLYFTREKHDVNGNPRYSVDGDALMTSEEIQALCEAPRNPIFGRIKCRIRAQKRANTIGLKKYRGRFRFVFQSYSINETAKHISRVTGRSFVAYKD